MEQKVQAQLKSITSFIVPCLEFCIGSNKTALCDVLYSIVDVYWCQWIRTRRTDTFGDMFLSTAYTLQYTWYVYGNIM